MAKVVKNRHFMADQLRLMTRIPEEEEEIDRLHLVISPLASWVCGG